MRFSLFVHIVKPAVVAMFLFVKADFVLADPVPEVGLWIEFSENEREYRVGFAYRYLDDLSDPKGKIRRISYHESAYLEAPCDSVAPYGASVSIVDEDGELLIGGESNSRFCMGLTSKIKVTPLNENKVVYSPWYKIEKLFWVPGFEFTKAGYKYQIQFELGFSGVMGSESNQSGALVVATRSSWREIPQDIIAKRRKTSP